LYAISGTGEFTYKRGEVISATNKVAEDAFATRFLPQNAQRVQARLFRIDDPQDQMARYGFPYQRPSKVKIGSKIPHLACRIPTKQNETLFALLEQDTSVPEPMNSPRRNRFDHISYGPNTPSALKFLPLDFRPGETDKKLTFIAQKPRTAEFLVKVPKETQTRQQQIAE